MNSPEILFKRLIHSEVEFVIVGDLAATVYGCRGTALKNEICLRLENGGIQKLRDALVGFKVCHRKTAERREVDRSELDTSTTPLFLLVDGVVLDCFGQVPGIGSFDKVLRHSEVVNLPIGACRILSISALIKSFAASGKEAQSRMVRELKLIEAQIR